MNIWHAVRSALVLMLLTSAKGTHKIFDPVYHQGKSSRSSWKSSEHRRKSEKVKSTGQSHPHGDKTGKKIRKRKIDPDVQSRLSGRGKAEQRQQSSSADHRIKTGGIRSNTTAKQNEVRKGKGDDAEARTVTWIAEDDTLGTVDSGSHTTHVDVIEILRPPNVQSGETLVESETVQLHPNEVTEEYRTTVQAVSDDELESDLEAQEVDDVLNTSGMLTLPTEEDDLTAVNHEAVEDAEVSVPMRKGVEKGDPSDDDPLEEVRPILKGDRTYRAHKASPEMMCRVYNVGQEQQITFRSKTNRLRTYASYDSKVMTGTPLARAGFKSGRGGDEVLCVWCCLILCDFTETVDAIAIHQVHSYQSCDFLKLLARKERSTSGGEVVTLDVEDFAPDADFASLPSAAFSGALLTTTSGPDALLGGGIRSDELEKLGHEARYQKLAEIRFSREIQVARSKLAKPKKGDLKHESRRRQTFIANQTIGEALARQLAADGIFWKSSYTECAFCRETYGVPENTLESIKDIIARHRKPRKFNCCNRQGNVPMILDDECWQGELPSAGNTEASNLVHLGVNTEMSKHPEFAVIDRRRATFLSFPYDVARGTEELVVAGYFSSGNGDATTCFSCGVTSSKWEADETAWQRHARSSPYCQFVRSEKGMTFISQMLEQFGEYQTLRAEDKIHNVTVRMMRPRWDTRVVQAAVEMGIDRAKVKTVVSNRIKRGERDFVRLADILRAVDDLDVPSRMLVPHLTTPALPTVREPPVEAAGAGAAAPSTNEEIEVDPVIKDDANDEHEPEDEPEERTETLSRTVSVANADEGLMTIEATPETYRQITSQLTCKICLSAVVGIIFLPCGHLVCCTACAAAMLHCPICRQDVKATIKANFNQE